MILASFVGIFAIPPLYVTFQWIAEKLRRGPAEEPQAAEKPKDAPHLALVGQCQVCAYVSGKLRLGRR